MFALVAMGLSLIYGIMDVVNFAHGEFIMLAMYFCFFMWGWFALDPLLSTPIATVVLFGLGVLIYRLLGRYLV
ncbi:MAG: branched-chain amino acid ABC transporter permease, partial [Alphaproteobacteria bacterium]|nr:branched-chain amino acid ABC transporter permease [Alphaproteobacteria bacterium]